MTSKAEQRASRALRAILNELPDGADLEDSERFRDVLNSLEFLIPQLLAELYPEWDRESLDGILPEVARKAGDREAEVAGLCILISDQAKVPIHLRLQISPSSDEISWLECRLGERGNHGMRRAYRSMDMMAQQLSLRSGETDALDWAYRITFGQRRPEIGTMSPHCAPSSPHGQAPTKDPT